MILASAISLTACGMIDDFTDTAIPETGGEPIDTFGDAETETDTGADTDGLFADKSMFGQCDADGSCDDGLTCQSRTEGGVVASLCVPSCAECEDPEVVAVADSLGPNTPVCMPVDSCNVPCADNSECNGDAVCVAGACAWIFQW